MPRICLLKPEITKLQEALDNGSLTTEKLAAMKSEDRGRFLREFLGNDDAGAFANGVFERKLLLENQQRAMETWINKMTDISEPTKRDMLSKVSRMEKLLSETDEKKFLTELAETKLGTRVTAEEANKLLALSKKAKELEHLRGTDARLEYGNAKVEFDTYMDDLKNPSNKKNFGNQLKTELVDTKGNPVKVVKLFGGLTKSLKAALDNSALLRQGLKTLITEPNIWRKNAAQSFKTLWNTIGGKDTMKMINADIVSRDNYDKFLKMKLAIGADEWIPTTLQEKIPGAGRLFKASDNAFKGFLFKTRADIADKYLQMAEKAGVNINDTKQLEAIGELVNSMTGRGNLGALEKNADLVNNVLFSPRFFKSQIDTLIHPITAGSKFTRIQATKNLGKMIVAIGGFMAIANAVLPGSAETNPLSTDFGKIKVKNTRFDITGGLGSLITLIARVSLSKSKNASNGAITKLNTGKFGGRTTGDVLTDFSSNKLSPIASIINDVAIRHRTFDGSKPTIGKEAVNLFVPLPITNSLQNLNDPNSAGIMAATIADFLGVSTNTYGKDSFKKNNKK